MKRSSALGGAALLAISCVAPATAQDTARFPAKPVRLIVPLPPGGGSDLLARTLAIRVSETWGQTLVIDNRGGAGGVIGVDMAAKAAADGYTIVMGYIAPLAINVSLGKLPYDPVNDLAPIALAALAQNVMSVHPSLPAGSVRELIAALKAKPGQYNYASAGNGSSPHLSAELFKIMAGVSMNHVPYKGAGPALIDLIAGQVALYIGSLPSTLPHIKANRVRALAVTGARRSPTLPDLPTVQEAGVPDFESSQWYGFLAPAKTPVPILDRLHKDLTDALTHPSVRERLQAQGFEVVASSRAQFSTYLRQEIVKWARVVKEAKIRAD